MVLVGTYPPRHCGIATFTAHLRQGLQAAGKDPVGVVAVVRKAADASRRPEVIGCIDQDRAEAYATAAEDLNRAAPEVVILQHEYGIFGGEDGRYVLGLLTSLRPPVITTLHTVRAYPTPGQRAVLHEIASRSAAVVVIARRAVALLRDVYGVNQHKVVFIPHGVPELNHQSSGRSKQELGLDGKVVAMTFGLLGPGKGIERVLEAMAAVKDEPGLVYLVVGATHPEERRSHGETYRHKLAAWTERLGLAGKVRFVDQYLTDAELFRYLSACDIYITPYPGREQISSGTLTYAAYMGKAILSTPYAYAEELLGGGAGLLVPYDDASGWAAALATLVRQPGLRRKLAAAAQARTAGFGWRQIGSRYARLAEVVSARNREARGEVPASVGR